MKRKLIKVAAVLLLVAGTGILAYPAISSMINQCLGSYAIQAWKQEVQLIDTDTLKQEYRRAELYNNRLIHGTKEIAEKDYLEILDFHDGIMGYIEIPDIRVNLPIYHGVSDAVLAKGVGHLPESSIPIGGEGNHAVLTGHTGLPSAELFTKLTELEKDDIFHITVLGEKLTYRVDQIKVVLPDDSRDLIPVAGKDLCTLVTCTPYGINSHRLLVRGRREVMQQLPTQAESVQSAELLFWLMMLLAILLTGSLVITVMLIWRRWEKKN